jgi:hypothetical protein
MAIMYGERALHSERQSIPSPIMISRGLAAVVCQRYSNEPAAHEYLTHLRDLGQERPGFMIP